MTVVLLEGGGLGHADFAREQLGQEGVAEGGEGAGLDAVDDNLVDERRHGRSGNGRRPRRRLDSTHRPAASLSLGQHPLAHQGIAGGGITVLAPAEQVTEPAIADGPTIDRNPGKEGIVIAGGHAASPATRCPSVAYAMVAAPQVGRMGA